MYEGDSFYTLALPQRGGLLLLSVLLMLGWLYLCRSLVKGRAFHLRLLVALALFAGFVWLSPQIYYQYYRLIFDGLPAQFVIGWPEGAGHILRLLLFQSDATLSAHGQGTLGWALIGLAAFRR